MPAGPTSTLALEPEAAGYRFARTLTAPATVLIGDFGGGTSDFSVLRFDPGAAAACSRSAMPASASPATCSTIRIIDRVISPLLGKGDTYTVMGKRPAGAAGIFFRASPAGTGCR